MKVKSLIAILVVASLSACVSNQKVDRRAYQDMSIKPEFLIEKISLQSTNLNYYGHPSVSEADALANWTGKAQQLCQRKSKQDVLRNELVSYHTTGFKNKPVNPLAEVACATTGAIGCVIALIISDNGEKEETIASLGELSESGSLRHYRMVEGKVFCP